MFLKNRTLLAVLILAIVLYPPGPLCNIIETERFHIMQNFDDKYQINCSDREIPGSVKTWILEPGWQLENGSLPIKDGIMKCRHCDIHKCTMFTHWVYTPVLKVERVIIDSKVVLSCRLSRFLSERNVTYTAYWTKTKLNSPPGFIVDKEERIEWPVFNDGKDLQLESVSYSDDGAYKCCTSSRFGEQCEHVYDIFVLSNSKEPHPAGGNYRFVLGSIGSTIEFHIRIPEIYSPSIIWTVNDEVINNTGLMHRIENLTIENNGVYKVQYKCLKDTGWSLCPFWFWLIVESVFTQSAMQNRTSIKNNTEVVQLNCDTVFMNYSGIAHDVTYLAFYNDYKAHFPDPERPYRLKNNFTMYVGQKFLCLISTILFGEFEKIMYIRTIDVQPGEAYPPFFENVDTYTENKHRFFVGSSGNLFCRAKGNPRPNITWSKDGKEINPALGKVSFKKWRIMLENLKENDTGVYECKVCNHLGCIEFTHWVLVGNLTDPTETKIVKANSDATIMCTRKYYAFIVKIEWFIPTVDHKHQRIFEEMDYTGRSHELRFRNVTQSNANTYICRVRSHFGFHERIVTLKLVDRQSSFVVEAFSIIVGVLSLFIMLIVIYKKIRRKGSYWLKRVIVTNAPKQNNDETGIQLPVTEIKMKKLKSPPLSDFEFPVDPEWEIPRPILGEMLGEGQFGMVFSAQHEGVQVAVKQLKDSDHSNQEVLNFYQEFVVMKMIGAHENILRLLGCCSRGGSPLIVVEHSAHGNLRDFLVTRLLQREPQSGYDQCSNIFLSVDQLVWFAHQVARGMEHLASIGYVHRDLAARNVLVFDGQVVKISDFGLARNIQSKNYYRKTTLTGLLPAAWMAPESLENDFYNSQSDVWSFGVLFWEVMTFGKHPYSGLNWEEILSIQKKGSLLEQPASCSSDIYGLMVQCWRTEPKARPSFSEIMQHFERLRMGKDDQTTISSGTDSDDESIELRVD